MKKRMKKRMIFFAAGVLSAALCLSVLAGCTDLSLSDSKESANSVMGGGNYGSLTVVPSGSGRALDVSELKYASVTVSGTGIPSGSEPSRKNVELSGGKGTVTVSNIPVGKNRIVTVQAFSNSDGAKIDGVRIRAVTDISEGGNSVIVDWNTTALGNVFASLYEKSIDISAVSADDKLKIQNAIDTTVNASLINASAIADDYISGVEKLKGKAEYVLAPANLTFSYTELSSYKVQVTDPSSAVATCSSGPQTVSNIAPGTWSVYILNKAGTVAVRKPLNVFESGKTIDLGSLDTVVLTDIIVHAKVPYIYIWDSGTSADKIEFTSMNDEGNGWYGYTIEASSAGIIFLSQANWSAKITGDLSRTTPGEYWFKDDKWYDYNPDKPVTPVIKADIKSGTYLEAQTVTLTGSNASDIIYYTTDGTEPTLSSSVYSSPIKVSKTMTIKAFGYNEGAEPQSGSVYEFAYKIDPDADVEPPVITPNKKSGKYTEALSDIKFTITDNKSNGVKVYYTTDGSVPTESSSEYLTISSGSKSGTGKSFSVGVKETLSIKLLAVDASGNETSASYTYRVTDGSVVDFREESIYFLMTTRFYDGDPSNNEYCWDEGGEYLQFGANDCAWRGDFKGLAEKLDYIKALGFSAIWITPVVENASGIDYHGYHAYDFSKVDPRYESAGFTYQDLIDACHKKGIKVIQDIVLNHTGNFGERNLFHMFDKETTPYVNKDIALPVSGAATKRSPFMKLATDGSYGATALSKALGGKDYDTSIGSVQYGARIDAMKEDSNDTDFIYHHCKTIDWNSENCQLGQMAGDCVDLNTENPVVFNYLKDCYTKYIEMGVDAFRIDTVKHISRYTFNKEFIPAFMEAGGEDFYIFGETCARYRGRWNEGVPALSPSFYTWKENKDFAWSQSDHAVNSASASAHFATYKSGYDHPAWADGIANHLLDGNDYHTPDWSMRSHLDQIDFPMHWAFSNAPDAFGTAVQTNDPDFNDATWNVVYVDSHDYAPDNAPEGQRYAKTKEWPRNMNLMFTFRGIPCIYYGSEIEFMAGAPIDPANTRTSLDQSGRAYFGDYITGSVEATDFGEYTASGTVQETLSHPLAQHVIRLNKIRRAIPALQKGQYSTEGCSGGISFKRRYTDDTVDSFALVAIGAQATFTGVPTGEYIEVITGKTVSCDGTLTSDEIGTDNMRVYVLKTATCGIDGKIGSDGVYLK